MSYKATAWAYDMPLRGPAKPVLVALADFADEAGSCYPGQDRICKMTGLSIRTVRRALERLEALELIAREHRHDVRGHRTSDRYVLALDSQSLPATLTSGQSDLRSESPSLPATVTVPTGQSDRGTVSRTNREPSGGRETPLTPWCSKHPGGTERPCRACKTARTAFEEALAAAAARPAPKAVIHIEGLCDAHRQPEATCEACAYERTHPVETYAGSLA